MLALKRMPIVFVCVSLAACGLYTPEKDPIRGDDRTPSGGSVQGDYESNLIDHITCEIANGLKLASRFKGMPWFFDKWGFALTLSTTSEDQSGVSPGITAISPLHNILYPFQTGGTVTVPQSFSFSAGASASANALRTETIEFTSRNRDVLPLPCETRPSGILMDGDLKIREFIYDKAVIIALQNHINERQDAVRPAFNAWTEEITFVSAYGGNITPTWKLATISSGASSNLLVSQRTNTNDLVVTFGPLADDKDRTQALTLTKDAMGQHFSRVQASAIAVSISGQAH